MAAKQPTKKPTNTKNTRSSKKKQEEKKRSIIPLLLLIILLLLGVIAYAYRDKLQVAWQSSKTHLQDNNSNKTEKQSRKKPSDKNKSNNDNPLQQAISQLENKFSATTTTTTTTTVASRRQSATTTTVKKFVPVTTTTTTTVRRVKATTTTSITTTTTIRRPLETTATTSTTTTTIAAVKSAKSEKPVVKTRTSKVYFTRVTMDDAYMIAAERTVNYIDSPLTETINVLLQGTNHAEDLKYVVTNIPPGTRLLGARISDEIAYLDFSSEFENNTYGKDSTLQQLKQIVYTATEFKGVDAVQFLINGRKQEYLGGEGVLIGEPLHRYDFR